MVMVNLVVSMESKVFIVLHGNWFMEESQGRRISVIIVITHLGFF